MSRWAYGDLVAPADCPEACGQVIHAGGQMETERGPEVLVEFVDGFTRITRWYAENLLVAYED